MKLTENLQTYIDSKSVYTLLYFVRFLPAGNELMMGESGEYWLKRLDEKRAEDPFAYTQASKQMGLKENE